MNPWLLNQGSKPSLHPKLLGLRVKESFLQNSRILSCRLRQQGHNGWKDGNRLKLLDKNVKAIQESHAQLRKDVDGIHLPKQGHISHHNQLVLPLAPTNPYRFSLPGFQEQDRLTIASLYLDDDAAEWIDWMYRNKQLFG
ncbi:hypothetical protein E1A91_A08G072300v1 [Gossypium mustelinum]|uniref:Uncharacterized protein n=1 Tax=Gossypium mustelinum TaxID=34275 RepID=A0A5D2Y5N6_GOSMU|nr:hypothetical protein E1A91_A08G072300v1 [Gossypium mustelinum]